MRRIGLLAAMVMLPGVAVAQPVSGVYIDGAVGGTFASATIDSQDRAKIYTGPGAVGLLGVGWGFGNGLRAELEGSLRASDVDRITTRRVNGEMLPLADVGGQINTYATLVNVLYDVDLGRFGLPVRPYLGGGLGIGWRDYNDVDGRELDIFHLPRSNVVIGPGEATFSGTRGAFAYQAIAGIAVPFGVLPGLEATVDYRFFGMASTSVSAERVALFTFDGVHPTAHATNRFDSTSQSILIGLRYAFGGPHG